MKNKKIFILTLCLSFLFTSCDFDLVKFFKNLFGSNKGSEAPKIEQPEPVVKPEEPAPVEIVEEPEEIITEEDEEYLRSIGNLDNKSDISKNDFNIDKAKILNEINELSKIMSTKDFEEWKKHIDPVSITYYSNPQKLQIAQNKLPNKKIKIKTLNDYFIYVFIPSRQRSQVDEIRYISKDNIKAVQVKEDKSIVVYYYFTKVDGNWLIHLPELD